MNNASKTREKLLAEIKNLKQKVIQSENLEKSLKETNQQLAASEQQYRHLIEELPDIVYKFSSKRGGIFWSPAVEKLLGFKSSDIKDAPKLWYNAIHNEDKVLVDEAISDFAKGKHFNIEYRIEDTSGKWHWFNDRSITRFSSEDETIIEGIAVDISERKKAENELRTALGKALESDRLKSAFLANMSHEIRTPMNGILGFIELLNTPELSNSKKQEFTDVINKSSNRLLNTISDLIDISKIEAGLVNTSNSEICIDKLLDELYVFFSPEATSKGLSLTPLAALNKNHTTIFADSDKLHGILTNLIKNAIKYTDEGSISYGYILKDDFIEFFVEDTGHGIPVNRQKAIFDRFVQADIGYSRAFEGSGLGLSISKAYAEIMGGEIWLTSEEGKGSKFMFTIPYKPRMNQAAPTPVPEIKEEIDTEKIFKDMLVLIAEDDVVTSSYYEIILKNKFRKIIYAKNGKETVEMCRNNPEIDIILMDIKMPDMDGYEASCEIRTFNKDVIIIAQTAYALKDEYDKAFKAGCDDYISKPIKKEKLIEMIKRLAKKKEKRYKMKNL